MNGPAPQRGIVIFDPEQAPAGPVDRIYFGAEFCCWRFPAVADLRRAFDLASRLQLPFSLLVPVFSEPFLSRLRSTLEALLPEFRVGDEVVLSDLGGLPLVREIAPDAEVVLGRALSGQKRGPRILGLDLKPEELDYFRQGSWYNLEAVDWLREQRIGRIELDNLLQGIAPLPAPLHGSLHLPWAMVTSSRNCPFRSPLTTGPCTPKCGEEFTLTTPQTALPLHQAGNTQFLENPTVPADLPRLRIDRLVLHHTLPR